MEHCKSSHILEPTMSVIYAGTCAVSLLWEAWYFSANHSHIRMIILMIF